MNTVVLLPQRDMWIPAHRRSLDALKAHKLPIFEVHSVHCVDMARAYLAEMALEYTKADTFMWIDDDIVFDPNDVFKIIEHCERSDYDILGAVYSTRKQGGQMVGTFAREVKTVDLFQPGLYDANNVGFGFAVVKRRVFEHLAVDFPLVHCPLFPNTKIRPYFMHLIHDKTYYTEDFSFCIRARQIGFKVGIDAEPRIFHAGQYLYGMEDVAFPTDRVVTMTMNLGHDESVESVNKAAE